jgi:putative tryptophan/tyrosine transport system substrate-binding protein
MSVLTRRRLLRDLVGLGASSAAVALAGGCGLLDSVPRARRVPQVGVLMAAIQLTEPTPRAILQGLSEAGYRDGDNIAIHWRSTAGREDRFPELAAELVSLPVDLIMTTSTQGTRAAMEATHTIPIVMSSPVAPIESGLVTSLAHPGGNVTGLAGSLPGLQEKRLELLEGMLTRLSRVAAVWNPTEPASHGLWTEAQGAGRRLAIQLDGFEAGGPEQLPVALARVATQRPDAVLFIQHPLFIVNRGIIVAWAAAQRLPAMYFDVQFVLGGGLVAYSANVLDLQRRAGTIVDKVLKGRRPGDLPVELPAKFDFTVNVSSADSLGITVPPDVAAQVTEWVQ